MSILWSLGTFTGPRLQLPLQSDLMCTTLGSRCQVEERTINMVPGGLND